MSMSPAGDDAGLPGLLLARARRWIADDPWPPDRAELTALVDAAHATGDLATLCERFSGALRFGTAGLRGPLRAGPAGMNTAVVRRTAAGLAAWLLARQAGPGASADGDLPAPLVVVGADARHGSERFALDSVRVLAGAGVRAALLPVPVPTPVLAFAVRRLGADAGIMVTASHNPATDNGYKVYLGAPPGDPANGAQIVAPVDSEIEAAIDAVGPAASLPLGDGWIHLGPEIHTAYVAAAAATLRPPGTGTTGSLAAGDLAAGDLADLRVAYTPLHGVGADTLTAVFTRAGLAAPFVVAEQARPDPDFPTVAFPNPEEPGALDRVLALGRAVDADVVIANDPDADRCAAAVGSRVLTGDEVGLLLADEVLRARPGPVATTIVSSGALATLATAHDVPCFETLTGFKWIMRAHAGLVFGYEEALGYAVAPTLVRDKDGITAALAIAGIAAAEKRHGRTLLDRLDDLVRRYGLHATAQVSVRVTDSARISAVMDALRAEPPARIGTVDVLDIHDLATTPTPATGPAPAAAPTTTGMPALADGSARTGTAGDEVPSADVVIFRLAGGGRVVVRPSGTEPKIKAYLEVTVPVEPTADADSLALTRHEAGTRLATLGDAVRQFLLGR
ncbi:phospho-sugar mutase [Protofrankia sp. BMG5.30]|uniref:phospho-sugar mutase n=1 Tax=Protofrankia sp. BMG5.30 TaxID=1834514 RepID=UPI000976E10E|nr:phospho-sugar mutase [Protofrankia sp. BMG5.30]ONH38416.1 phosphoglucomutase [Protofrankia sp. BMG5.30]